MPEVEIRSRPRIHVGHVELVPELPPPVIRFARLRTNLVACRSLLVAVVLAQVADVVTTQVARTLGGYYETNPVLRPLVDGSPVGALALKLVLVAAVLGWALIRLPVRRAQVAVSLALALSLIGPAATLLALLGR